MAIRPIVLYPDPVLLRPTEPVAEIDDEVCELVRDMVETMNRAPGVGLAANQVGISRRICIVDLSAGQEPGGLHVFINPRIVESAGQQMDEEGCLSFPDIMLEIRRAHEATVEALDLDGSSRTVTYDGLMARVVLHECEHLDGKVFLQNVSPLKRELVKRQIRKRMKQGDWKEAASS